MAKRDVYIAIMVAAAKGKGLRLSADEVGALTMDDAIETRAVNGLSADEYEIIFNAGGWSKIDPRGHRQPSNKCV